MISTVLGPGEDPDGGGIRAMWSPCSVEEHSMVIDEPGDHAS